MNYSRGSSIILSGGLLFRSFKMGHRRLFLFHSLCFGLLFSVISAQPSPYGGGPAYPGAAANPYGAPPAAPDAAGGYGPSPALSGAYPGGPSPALSGGYPGGAGSLPGPYGALASQTGSYDTGADARGYGGSGYSQYGNSYGGSSYGQGSGVYFKKPVPIDEKPVFFRTPYWLPNLYYGHYGYPWTQWFDGGPRFVVPIMNAFPRGGGGTQSYNTGYGAQGVGQSGYGGSGEYSAQNGTSSYSSGTSSYGGGSPAYGGAGYADATTTPDPYNDGFSYYKGIPIYQTYYERYLLEQAQAATTTAAPAGK